MNIKKHLKYGVVAATFAGIGMLASGIAANADTGKAAPAVNQCVSDVKDDAGAVTPATEPTTPVQTPTTTTTTKTETEPQNGSEVVSVDKVVVKDVVHTGDISVLDNNLNNLHVENVLNNAQVLTHPVTGLLSNVSL